jgi:hypothetical protein
MTRRYCYSCGSKLKQVFVKTGFYDTYTGKAETFSYLECPKYEKLKWYQKLWHGACAF